MSKIGKRLVEFAIASCVIHAAVCFAGQPAPENADKGVWFGFKPYEGWNAVGGLSFKWGEPERDAPLAPRLLRGSVFSITHPSFKEGQHDAVMQPAAQPGLDAQWREWRREESVFSWAHAVIRYPGATVHISRLTPAALFEVESDCLVFENSDPGVNFARTPTQMMNEPAANPTRLVYPSEDGGLRAIWMDRGMTHSFADELEEPAWVLLCYGDIFFTQRLTPSFVSMWNGSDVWHTATPNVKAGIDARGDRPVLLVFSQPPESLETSAQTGGVVFYFQESGIRAAVVQPFENFFDPIDTEPWFPPPDLGVAAAGETRMPAEARARCEEWAQRLQHFPVGAVETGHVREDGTLVIREEFEYLPLSGGRAADKEKWMPLPPIWALAAEEGFPVMFSAEVEDSGVYTYLGPYKGIVGGGVYEAEFPGLERHLFGIRTFKGGQGSDPDWLAPFVAELEKGVGDAIAAGRLAPWFHNPAKQCMDRFLWANSADTLYFLAQCMPAVSEKTRDALIAYLRAIDAEHPPESENWLLPYTKGARRERYVLPGFLLEDSEDFPYSTLARYLSEKNFYRKAGMVPAQNLYALAALYAAAPGAAAKPIGERWPAVQGVIQGHLPRIDWAGAFFAPPYLATIWGRQRTYDSANHEIPMQMQNGAEDANRWFAGTLGFARLARMAGDEEAELLGRRLFARAAIQRHAFAVFVPNLHRRRLFQLPEHLEYKPNPGCNFEIVSGARYFRWEQASDDAQQVARADEFQVMFGFAASYRAWRTIIPFVDMTPELGRFLHDHARAPNLEFIRAVEKMPNWYVTETEDSFAREQGFEFPECAWQMVLAKLWIERDAPEKISEYIDVPWTKLGDYYHIQKLAELIMAARGYDWVENKGDGAF